MIRVGYIMVGITLITLKAQGATEAVSVSPTQLKLNLDVKTFTLPNGMRFLLVQKKELPMIHAGWVAHVGSANERPGITGLAHLFEHMMFKGTKVIGTKDYEKEKSIMEEKENLQERIRELYSQQRQRYYKGEIEDPFDPDTYPQELKQLLAEFEELDKKHKELIIKDDFTRIYKEAGAANFNAFTTYDLTGYIISVPANKLELWFWMESERLLNPVFREFYTERDVVQEERRLRTESTPTGKFDELIEAAFWQSHPYKWPVIGWPSDLKIISMKQAQKFYDMYYAPNNITAVLVGNFDIEKVKELADKYFGRLKKADEIEEVVTLEMPQLAYKEIEGECDCQPQIKVMYHTVPFIHKDAPAFEVLAELLNGYTGRLYKTLVLEKKIASSAFSYNYPRKYAGSFIIQAETSKESTPKELYEAWQEILEDLKENPVSDKELQKVKNKVTADSFRRLENPFMLMLQLVYYDGLGDWKYLLEWGERVNKVTKEDIQKIVKKYLTKENTLVAFYYRKKDSESREYPAEITELPPEIQSHFKRQLDAIQNETDKEKLEKIYTSLLAQEGNIPPEIQKAFETLKKTIENRIQELENR